MWQTVVLNVIHVTVCDCHAELKGYYYYYYYYYYITFDGGLMFFDVLKIS